MADEAPKNKGGRPTGYRKVDWNESNLKAVESMKALGATNAYIAHHFGIAEKTLYENMATDPRLSSALKFGKEKANLAVAQTAFAMAKSGEDGPMTRFWLTTQAGWHEKVDVKVENTIVFETRVTGGQLKQNVQELDGHELEEMDNIIDVVTEEITGKSNEPDGTDRASDEAP